MGKNSRQMSEEHGSRIDERVLGLPGGFTLALLDPERRKPIGRFAGLDALNTREVSGRMNRQRALHQNASAGNQVAVDGNAVSAFIRVLRFPEPDLRDDEPHLLCELAPEVGDSGHQRPLHATQMEGNGRAHLHLDSFQVVHHVGVLILVDLLAGSRGRAFLRNRLAPNQIGHADHAAYQEHRQHGHAGQQTDCENDDTDDKQGARECGQLPHQFPT